MYNLLSFLGITTTVNKIKIPVYTYVTLVDDLSVHCDGTRNRMTSTFDNLFLFVMTVSR